MLRARCLATATNPALERSWYLFHVTYPAPERSWYLFNVAATLLILPLQRSCTLPDPAMLVLEPAMRLRALQCPIPGPYRADPDVRCFARGASPLLLIRSWNAPGTCSTSRILPRSDPGTALTSLQRS